MTHILILVRHAKSSWDNPDLVDHSRPLNKRGVLSALAMGKWLGQGGWKPDQTLSSSSQRTRETFERLGCGGEAEFTDKLYHAGTSQMFQVLKAATGKVVLMLGHNPGIAEFAERLLTTLPEHPRFLDYPTCSTLIAEFDIADWADLAWGAGTAVDFITPHAFGIGKAG